MTRLALISALVLACGAPAPAPSASATIAVASASPSELVTATPSRAASSIPRGTLLVPFLSQTNLFPNSRFDIRAQDRPGQPGEGIVWQTDPFRADAGYVSRAATALGVTGASYVSAAPSNSAPWRMWFGAATLAVNEVSGEVLFLATDRDDGRVTTGPAQRAPAIEVERLAKALGTPADITPTPGYLPSFRGTDAAARFGIAPLTSLGPSASGPSKDRQSAFVFTRYAAPLSQKVTIYDTDEYAVLTSRQRVAAYVHRPLGTLRDPAVYPITTYGQALAELKKDPGRYVRVLSGPEDDFLALTIDPSSVVLGHAWANTFPNDLRRNGRTLVPVWVFPAGGFATDGTPVQALFIVDAVVPEMRAPQVSGALAIGADELLLAQLNGARWADPQVVAADAVGPGCSGARLERVDADTFAGTSTCNGRIISFKISRAFPGYDGSVWYWSDVRK